MLPSVCKYNALKGANNARQARVLKFLLDQDAVQDVVKKYNINTDTADLGDVLDGIIRELGMPRSLKDVGVGRDQLDKLAEHSLEDRWCKTNPVPLEEKGQVLEILEMVVGA